VQLAIEVAYDVHGMWLDGAVTSGGIALHEFTCERIGQLTRSAVRRRDGEGT
jgi:hypothetical protein